MANVLLPARANSVAAPVAPTPPPRRKPMGGALFPISGIRDLVAAIFGQSKPPATIYGKIGDCKRSKVLGNVTYG